MKYNFNAFPSFNRDLVTQRIEIIYTNKQIGMIKTLVKIVNDCWQFEIKCTYFAYAPLFFCVSGSYIYVNYFLGFVWFVSICVVILPRYRFNLQH